VDQAEHEALLERRHGESRLLAANIQFNGKQGITSLASRTKVREGIQKERLSARLKRLLKEVRKAGSSRTEVRSEHQK
ncbi:MAG TPA: hypothetical protein VKF84_02805, partial [Candidatus Sulfotelmatobacter sp.]|nr:hypothetical protein [Candidatus Sulfotelmatobacter sp.]